MAQNPYKNKVIYNGQTLIDLTGDTVVADKLLEGYTAHDAAGRPITGTAPQGSGSAISIIDTQDAAGGTIRTINAVSLAGDTVAPSNLLSGYTAHNSLGQPIVGTASGGGSSIKRGVIRPDAVLVESWSYDKLWIEEEHGTLPAYSTSAVTLKASEALTVTHTWNLDDYKYIVLVRCLVIPIYTITTIARGRMEWSQSNGAYELLSLDANTIHSLVDPTKFVAYRNLSWVSSGATLRMPYFTNSIGQLSMYSATSYGIWCTMVTPTYGSGQLGINSPSFTLRCQANVFDQPFYEALDDIRFQWKIELWREPIGSLQYDGWTAYQDFGHILDCVNSADHTLT